MDAVLEIIVHLDHFENIDLFRQGLYHIRVKIYNEKKNIKEHLAFPYHIIKSSKHDVKKRIYQPCTIDQEDNEFFQSSSIYIQYSHQKIMLNNACLFRLRYYIFNQANIICELQLMMCELDHNKTTIKKKEEKKIIKFQYTIASTIQLALPSLNNFTLSRMITFEQSHYCQCNITISGSIVNYKLNPTYRPTIKHQNNIQRFQYLIYKKNQYEDSGSDDNLQINVPYSMKEI